MILKPNIALKKKKKRRQKQENITRRKKGNEEYMFLGTREIHVHKYTLSFFTRGEGKRKGNPSRKSCLPKCEHFKHKNPLFGLNDWNIYCN